jgi:hypothetical protein
VGNAGKSPFAETSGAYGRRHAGFVQGRAATTASSGGIAATNSSAANNPAGPK